MLSSRHCRDVARQNCAAAFLALQAAGRFAPHHGKRAVRRQQIESVVHDLRNALFFGGRPQEVCPAVLQIHQGRPQRPGDSFGRVQRHRHDFRRAKYLLLDRVFQTHSRHAQRPRPAAEDRQGPGHPQSGQAHSNYGFCPANRSFSQLHGLYHLRVFIQK